MKFPVNTWQSITYMVQNKCITISCKTNFLCIFAQKMRRLSCIESAKHLWLDLMASIRVAVCILIKTKNGVALEIWFHGRNLSICIRFTFWVKAEDWCIHSGGGILVTLLIQHRFTLFDWKMARVLEEGFPRFQHKAPFQLSLLVEFREIINTYI